MDKKVLIVDDSAFMRKIIATTLKEHNIVDVDYATNGKEAIKKYKAGKYDYVTMDITMNEMNGLDALKEIINFDPAAKVIMVSAMGQKPFVLEAVKYGACDFVTKPFNEESVKKSLEKIKNS